MIWTVFFRRGIPSEQGPLFQRIGVFSCCHCLACRCCFKWLCGKQQEAFTSVNVRNWPIPYLSEPRHLRFLQDVWYHINSNQLFCLLGPNGAGKVCNLKTEEVHIFAFLISYCLLWMGVMKTTTINMLTGQVPPSHGDALIYGLSIKHEMNKIRQMMGVCPQFDVLWDDLTGKEHIKWITL